LALHTGDSQDLRRFGYAQELIRSMGGFSNFAISFSIISILTGAVTLYGYGLEMGGPLQMTLGWPLATIFTLALAASMAELCSAYPTSGAMYHWAAALGGPAWGWFTAWLNIIGLVAAQAGINYGCAQFVLPFLGLPATTTNVLLMFAFTLVVHGMLNHFGVSIVAMLNNTSVIVHIVGVLVIVVCIFALAPRQPVSFLFEAVNSNGRSPYMWAFLLGLLQAQWTYTGFDASAHMAEETSDPRRTAPWGIVLAVAVSGVAGYALLIALTLAISSIPAALSAKDSGGNAVPAAIAVFQNALGPKLGNTLGAFASVAMWFCGLSCVTSASRALYSLARDGGVPGAAVLMRVSPRYGTPGPAIWAVVVASMVAMLWTGAVPIVTSLSTVSLYLAYVIPVILGYHARRNNHPWTTMAVWQLGRYGGGVNLVAIVYALFVCVVLVMPPNQLAGMTLLSVLLALVLTYRLAVRSRYSGPKWVEDSTGKTAT
jgi:amino acid transporter